MDCNWLMMRSFHCPNLVRIGCNADFLSRFQVSDVSGMTVPLIAGSGKKLFYELNSNNNESKTSETTALAVPHSRSGKKRILNGCRTIAPAVPHSCSGKK